MGYPRCGENLGPTLGAGTGVPELPGVHVGRRGPVDDQVGQRLATNAELGAGDHLGGHLEGDLAGPHDIGDGAAFRLIVEIAGAVVDA